MAQLDHDRGAGGTLLERRAGTATRRPATGSSSTCTRAGSTTRSCITGDWHSTFANDIKLDFDDPRSRPSRPSSSTPSISSNGDDTPYGPYYGPMVPFNPHIRFFDGDRRGSMTARLGRCELEVDWRIADRVASPDAKVRTLKRFAVEAGRPGLAEQF